MTQQCPFCGQDNREKASFCGHCGRVLSKREAPPPLESTIQAFIQTQEKQLEEALNPLQDILNKLYGTNGKSILALARCTKTKQPFGLRFQASEVLPSFWWLTAAFALRGESAQRGGYDASELTGRFGVHPEYPGCPYCQAQGLYHTSCNGKLACWDKTTNPVLCAWCDQLKPITGTMTSITKVTDF